MLSVAVAVSVLEGSADGDSDTDALGVVERERVTNDERDGVAVTVAVSEGVLVTVCVGDALTDGLSMVTHDNGRDALNKTTFPTPKAPRSLLPKHATLPGVMDDTQHVVRSPADTCTTPENVSVLGATATFVDVFIPPLSPNKLEPKQRTPPNTVTTHVWE